MISNEPDVYFWNLTVALYRSIHQSNPHRYTEYQLPTLRYRTAVMHFCSGALSSAICLGFTSVNRPLHTAWHVAPWPCLLVITLSVGRPSKRKVIEAQQKDLNKEAKERQTDTHNHYLLKRLYTFQAGWNFTLRFVGTGCSLCNNRLTFWLLLCSPGPFFWTGEQILLFK